MRVIHFEFFAIRQMYYLNCSREDFSSEVQAGYFFPGQNAQHSPVATSINLFPQQIAGEQEFITTTDEVGMPDDILQYASPSGGHALAHHNSYSSFDTQIAMEHSAEQHTASDFLSTPMSSNFMQNSDIEAQKSGFSQQPSVFSSFI